MKNRILFTLMLGAQVLILQAQTAVNPWQITLGANAVEFYERGGTQYQTGNDGIQFDNKINWGKRNAILGELSPFASFITYNYNVKNDISLFVEKAEAILSKVQKVLLSLLFLLL